MAVWHWGAYVQVQSLWVNAGPAPRDWGDPGCTAVHAQGPTSPWSFRAWAFTSALGPRRPERPTDSPSTSHGLVLTHSQFTLTL